MLLFFAGTESRQWRDAAIEGGAKNSLQSFYSLGCGKKVPDNTRFKNYLLDSGGYSARKHGINIDVKEYASYLNRYKIEVAFNLDFKDNELSLENQRFLELNTQTYILPVYHGTEWMDKRWDGLLEYYIENYPYIALGGMAGKENSKENLPRFLNYVFSRTKDKTMVHGLGMTSEVLLEQYPFFTVDSTSWMQVGLFGTSKVHGEEWAKVNAKMRHYSDNVAEEIPYWLKMGEDVTRLWEKRGIRWGDFNYDTFISKRDKEIPTFEEWRKNAK